MATIIKKVSINKCERCGYEWQSNDPGEKPPRCARCKNPYWDRPRQKDLKRNGK